MIVFRNKTLLPIELQYINLNIHWDFLITCVKLILRAKL